MEKKEVSKPSDAGWKKINVPSNAISKVIGRRGSSIDTIKKLSGAHIKAERQSKGHGDRTILIKGSAKAIS